MFLWQQGGRSSWRILSQLRHTSSSSLLSLSPSAHLGLQRSRLQGLLSSSSFLHHVCISTSFSSSAEAAPVANSRPEAFPSVDSITEMQEASSAVAPNLEGEQEGSILRKMLEEHRELVSTLRAELEERKYLTQSILDRIRVLNLSNSEKTADSSAAAKRQIQSEWTAFMEYLHSCDFFQEENGVCSEGSVCTFDDPARVRRAIYKFSQAHNSVFESLSPIDLRILARHGCTNNDPKAASSQKSLRQFFKIEDVSSNAAAAAAEPAAMQPKLSDVTRLLYSTILEGSYEDEVKSAISHLLREVASSSRKSSMIPALTADSVPTNKPSTSLSTAASDMTEELKQEKRKPVKLEHVGNTQKAGTVNVEEATKIATRVDATKPEAATAPAPLWKCPRCSFMNLDTKHRCVECSRRRPQRTYQLQTEKSNNEAFLPDHVSEVKVPVDKRPARKALERKDCLPSPSTQVRDNMKEDRSLCLAKQDEGAMELEHSSTEAEVASDGSEAFSVLDDILESEDSEVELQEGKQSGLSDDSEEDKQGKGKRAVLSKLFPKLEFPESRRDNQRGLKLGNERRNRGRFPNGRRLEDDDGIRGSKFGSLGVDEQEGSIPRRSRGGYGSRDDDYTRRGDNRDGRKGRGGRDYGGGGGGRRGDSFEGRHDSGGPRNGSAHGGRDGGRRSSSFGSRSPRGRSMF